MRRIMTAALSAAVLLGTPWVSFGGIQMSLRAGRVSIAATDVTAAEILAEWAKLGRVRVVNPELLPPERVSIELQDVSEEQALAIVLRRAAGYVAARRDAPDPDASSFDRILVMRGVIPTAVQARVAPAPPAPPDDDTTAAAAGDDVDDPPPPTTTEAVVPGARASQAAPTPGRATPDYRAALVRPDDPRVMAADDAPPAGMGPNQVSIGPSAVTPRVQQALPPRPFTSGQMAGRRPADPARDVMPKMPSPPQVPGTVAPAFDEPIIPTGPVTLPREDPVAQEVFKTRRAVETVDPSTIEFKMPKPSGTPGTTTGKIPSATTPGVSTAPAQPSGPIK